nr:UDP-N-acetylmuramate dehydrogenase [Desulfobulbaceae bacterium]
MRSYKETIKNCWDNDICWDCPLSEYTTLKVGGPADALIKPGSARQLQQLIEKLSLEAVPWQILGHGSNVVVADEGVDGVVILLGPEFAAIWQDEEGRVTVEAGCSLAKLGKWCADRSMSGLEFTAGIPGSVGGAVVMNAGAWGHEMKDVLHSLEVMGADGQLTAELLSADDFQYRKWNKKAGRVVVSATLNLSHCPTKEIAAKSGEYIRQRNEKQPKGLASAGSFFKNIKGIPAGMLIEKAGLKGLTIGGAQVSRKHANFFVNTGSAKAVDFVDLMTVVQQKVADLFAVELVPEVKFIGRW